jgi:hypothetical protein
MMQEYFGITGSDANEVENKMGFQEEEKSCLNLNMGNTVEEGSNVGSVVDVAMNGIT